MEEIVSKFYNNLYESQVPIPEPVIPKTSEVPHILVDKVEKAAKQMSTGKSPGLDKISIEEIKCGGETMDKAITERITWYINTYKISSDWKTSKTILLPKKGNKADIKNYT